MKKKAFAFLSIALLGLTSWTNVDDVITKEDGMTVVNTTSISSNVKGYMDNTPVKIYIKKDKIVKVVALPNKETRKYFSLVVKEMLPKWSGMSVKEARKTSVDGVTGATMSSDALKKNVELGLEYYVKKGKK